MLMSERIFCAHISEEREGIPERVQTCTEHARNVASLASEMLAPQGLFYTGYLAGLLHDCGKFTDEFNAYLHKAVAGEPVKKGSIIHTFAGVRYLLECFHSSKMLKVGDLTAEILAAAVGSHHGLIDIWDQQMNNGFKHRLHKQPEYDAKAIQAFNECCAEHEEVQKLYDQAQSEVMDFYRSKILPYAKNNADGFYALGLLTRLLTSAIIDADRTDTALFMNGFRQSNKEGCSWETCLSSIEEYISSFLCNTPIQQARSAFSSVCAKNADQSSGLYRLDLPTGGGKTLAALRFAVAHAKRNNMRRIFYIAPLLSIIEQNSAVIREAVNESMPVLEHHSDIIKDKLSPEEAERIEMLQETWEAPMIVTTLVQLLETLFSGKTSSVRRFHQLADSVIIIDEVQSLPPKMLTIFNGAVNFLTRCCGTTVVLCSATQPAFKKARHPMVEPKRLVPEEMYNKYATLFQRTEIMDAGLCSIADVSDLAEDVLQNSDSLLIMCNTKREASELYKILNGKTESKCFHLSAGMCMAHRKVILDELTTALSDREKLICVSTQVIEAGIDISFGAVIRFSAGLDNIVQAAGRCNRHGEYGEMRPVHICRVADEKLGSLKEIRDAQNALNSLLSEYKNAPEKYRCDLTSDEAVGSYYSFLYNEMAYGAQDYPTHGQTLFDLLSRNTQFASTDASSYFLKQAFRTAGEWFEVFDNDSETILIPYREGKGIIEKLAKEKFIYDLSHLTELLEKAKPFTVSVAATKAEQMRKSGAVYTLINGSISVLNEGYYDEKTGIKEGNDLCSTLIL